MYAYMRCFMLINIIKTYCLIKHIQSEKKYGTY